MTTATQRVLTAAEYEKVEMTAETLLGDMLKIVMDEIKALPNVWQKLPMRDQQDVIDRVTKQTAGILQRAVEIIASDNRPTILATCESVTFKDGIKAVVTCSQASPARHDLADAAGCLVMLVLADAEPYMGGSDSVSADKDQQSWLDSAPGTRAPHG